MKRSELPDNVFGIPQERKYPMPDKRHTLSAIKLFGHVEPKYEEELAKNIIKNMKKYNIPESAVGKDNKLRNYIDKKSTNESYLLEESNASEYSMKPIKEDQLKEYYKWFKIVFNGDKNSIKEKEVKSTKVIYYQNEVVGYIAFSRYKDGNMKYLGIGNFMVIPKYQRSGHGKNVIKYIIDKYKDTYNLIYCWVDRSNTNAINFYKKIGKVYMNTKSNPDQYYVEFYRKRGSTNESYLLEESNNYLEEKYIMNDKDIYYNKDKFDNGGINLCFITGHSGSGKSTMGRDMQSNNIEHYELDDLQCIKDHFTMQNLKEYGDLIYSYFNGKGKKFYISFKELENNKTPGSEYEDILYKDFVKYAMDYAKSHKNKKYVIEGVWLFCSDENNKPYFSPEEFKDYAFYIKGTSAIVSKHRAALRDAKKDSKGSKLNTVKGYIPNMIRKNWKWYMINEKRINVFRNYFSKLIKEATVSEFYSDSYIKEKYIMNEISSTINKDYQSKGKKFLSSFKKEKISREALNKYKKDFKALSHIRENCLGYIYLDKDIPIAVIAVEEKSDCNFIQAVEILKKYQGYGLSKQLLNVAVKELKATRLSVNKKNKLAIDIYKKYGFKEYGNSDTMIFMSINESSIEEQSTKSQKIYHLSQSNMNGKTISPRIPSNYFTKNGYEDGKTARVCFAKSIDMCLRALSQKCTDMELYVHIPDGNYNIYNPSTKEVPDCKITSEVWIKEPVKLKCIGKIKVIKDKGEDGIPYKYGNNTAELYDWEWKWMQKINESILSEFSVGAGPVVGIESNPEPIYIVNYLQNNVFSGAQQERFGICKAGMKDLHIFGGKYNRLHLSDLEEFEKEASNIRVYKYIGTPLSSIYSIVEDSYTDLDFYRLLTGQDIDKRSDIEFNPNFVRESYIKDELSAITECVNAGVKEIDNKYEIPLLGLNEDGRVYNYYRDLEGVYIKNEVTNMRSGSYIMVEDIPEEVSKLVKKGVY